MEQETETLNKKTWVQKALQSRHLTDEERKAKVEQYFELRKTMKIEDVEKVVGISNDSLRNWAKRLGYGDRLEIRQTRIRTKLRKQYGPRKPRLVHVPVEEQYETHTTPARITQPVETVVPQPEVQAPTQGPVIVLMGDADTVRQTMQTAFNLLTGKK